MDTECEHGTRNGNRCEDCEALALLHAEIDRLRAAIESECNATIFEDGLSGDLRDTGVRTLPQAYMAGRTDVLDELRAALAQEGV